MNIEKIRINVRNYLDEKRYNHVVRVAECAKEHPKCREVLKGFRIKTHGFVFKYIKD